MFKTLAIASAALALVSVSACHQPKAQAQSGAPMSASNADWFSDVHAGRSPARAPHAMVASSQPLASMVGLDVLKRGGNAVDAAIAMAAMLNVTEPSMTGIGGDAFMMVYSAKTKKLEGLNASGRAPKALTLDYFAKHGIKE